MRVFKAYFMILNKYKGTVFIFFAVFMSISLIMAKVNGGGGTSTFKQDSLDIAIVDEDHGEFSGQLREYFGTHNQVTEMKMDQDKIADALYWRKLDYVLVIPKGTDEVISKGGMPELSCMKVPGYFDSAYFEAALQMYLQKITALTGNGSSLCEAGQKLTALQEKETKVHMASFVNKRQGDMSTRFFLYVPYLFIAVGVSGIGLVLLRLNRREVRERTECSSMPMKNRVAEITAAGFVYGICMYLSAVVCCEYFYHAFVWIKPWLFRRYGCQNGRCDQRYCECVEPGALLSRWHFRSKAVFRSRGTEGGKNISDLLVCGE